MKRIDCNTGWTCNGAAVTLPHDGMIGESRSPENPSGTAGAFYPGGVYQYRRQLTVEDDAAYILEIEGAYKEAEVQLNGQVLAKNHLGYVGFTVDLTPGLQSGENDLTVTVRNDQLPNARWYTGGGLYRPVWLWKGGATRIAHTGIRVSTPACGEDVSEVVVQTPIVNGYGEVSHVRLETQLLDADGAVVCHESTPVTLFPGEDPVITQRLYLRGCRLWSPESPALYTCRVTLREDAPWTTMDAYRAAKAGKAPNLADLDSADTVFGIRHIQADPVHGLRINGKEILLRGACIHPDNGVLGGVSLYGAELRRVQKLKEAGFNAIRIAHQPASKALLDVCDRLGMLLMEETFDLWTLSKTAHDDAATFDADWPAVLSHTVEKDFNHPSVILYSIGNEIGNLHTEDGIRYSRLLSDAFRKLDPTRLVTNAINGGMMSGSDNLAMLLEDGLVGPADFARLTGKPDATAQDFVAKVVELLKTGDINDLMTVFTSSLDKLLAHPVMEARREEVCSHLDVCGYNYMLSCYEHDTKSYPNRILYGSETNPPKIDPLWAHAEQDPANLGDFTWTGWDYIGETGVGITDYEGTVRFAKPYPGLLAYCGDLDITGYRRPLSYLREIVFGLRKAPYLSAELPQHYGADAKNTPWSVTETVHSWTWRGYEGKPIRVAVYTPGDRVALLLNGQEIGSAPVEHCQAYFETAYQPGVLEAVAYADGQEVGRDRLETAKGEVHLAVQEECFGDLRFLEVQLADANGIPVMDAEHQVSVSLAGEAVLLGFGSGDPCSTENFQSPVRTTYRGRLLAVVRGAGEVSFAMQ